MTIEYDALKEGMKRRAAALGAQASQAAGRVGAAAKSGAEAFNAARAGTGAGGAGSLPPYRTPNGFQQTPPPTNPSYRPAPKAGIAARAGGAVRSVAKPLARVAAPLAGVAGAAQTAEDMDSGFYEHSQQLMGANADGAGNRTLGGDLARNTFKVAADVGDAATFGVAGRVGRGISNIGSEGGFIGGFTGPSARESFAARGAASAAPTARVMPIEDGRYDANKDVVGNWNGRDITRAEADRRAGELSTTSAYSGAKPAAVEASQGYQAQGLRGSRAPSEEDRRRLYHDLSGIGRGSPGIRAALLERFNDQFNNAEQGQNQMAIGDLAAGARSQDGFAERKLDAGRHNSQLDFDREKLGVESDIASRQADARINLLDELRKNAKAQREADAYEQTRPGLVDEQLAKRREQLKAENPNMTSDELDTRLAIESGQAGLAPDSSITGAAGVASVDERVRDLYSTDEAPWINVWGIGDDEAPGSKFTAREIPGDRPLNLDAVDVEDTGWWRQKLTGAGKNRVSVQMPDGKREVRYTDDDELVDSLSKYRRTRPRE